MSDAAITRLSSALVLGPERFLKELEEARTRAEKAGEASSRGCRR